MRVAKWSVLLAALALVCYGMGLPQEKPADPVPESGQQPPTHVATPPPGAAVPGAAGSQPKPVAAAGLETDPGKMAESAKPPAPPPLPSYVIGAEDVLGISVWGEPRLSGSFLVRPDGRISLNLIGEVTATGQTPNELESAIGELLKKKDILKDPQVAVQVTQINSKKYFLQGEVNRTGAFPLVVPTTVLEALVNAGGFRDFANQKNIDILRGIERFRFNYKDVIRGKHREQNIFLKPGDIIIVR